MPKNPANDTTRGTPTGADVVARFTAIQERNNKELAERRKKGLVTELEERLILNRDLASDPEEIASLLTQEIQQEISRKNPINRNFVANNRMVTAEVDYDMVQRAVRTDFQTTFNNDAIEAEAIAVAATANKNTPKTGWLNMGTPSSQEALQFSADKVRDFLIKEGVKFNKDDLTKIITEGSHFARGSEVAHRQRDAKNER